MEDRPGTAAQHAETARGPSACPNCQAGLSGKEKYCPQCGQTTHDLRMPFRHLVAELFEAVLHLDNKLLRTLQALLLHPGLLSVEFRRGRRASYVPPLRLYVVVSFLFFLLLAMGSGSRHGTEQQANDLNLTFYTIQAKELKGLSPVQADSLLEVRGVERTSFNRYMAAQMGRIAGEGRSEFSHLLLKGVSYMMFVLMPLFALFVILLFRSRAGYYVESLVFSVHVHAFVFLVLGLCLLVGRLGVLLPALLAAIIYCGVYLTLALRRVYQQGMAVTLGKTVVLGGLHLGAIALAFLGTVMISIMLY